jgi:hypothetical protein
MSAGVSPGTSLVILALCRTKWSHQNKDPSHKNVAGVFDDVMM